MVKYGYDWLINQYKQEFGCVNEDVLAALKAFVGSKSRDIFYDLAIMFYYKKPIWFIKLVARFQVRRVTQNTALAEFEDVIVKKLLTDAKAKTLRGIDYYEFGWRELNRSDEKSIIDLLSKAKEKIAKILHIKV